MLMLEKGAYLGKVLDLSQADGVLAGTTSYYPNDGTQVMHYHENSHLSFVLRGGGMEKRKSSEFERLPGQLIFFHAGERHQSINKLFPARNVNLEIESVFLRDNGLTEADVSLSVVKNPNSKFIMLKGLRCKDYFQARKFFECIRSGTDPEQRSDKLRLPLRITP